MMGNVHVVKKRVTALSMACLASAGLILCALSGYSCSYVTIVAQPDRNLMPPDGEEEFDPEIGEIGIGVVCDSPFYVESDRMWTLSQLFFWISLGLGGLTTLLAWTLSLCVPPKPCTWRTMSLLGAATAVMEVPIFLLFESEPCNMDISRQTCQLSIGAYFNIASVILWVAMTLWTQLLDPPDWSTADDDYRGGSTSGVKTPVREIRIPSSASAITEDCSPQNGGSNGSSPASGLFLNSKKDLNFIRSESGTKLSGQNGAGDVQLGGDDNLSEISSISETDLESARTPLKRHQQEERSIPPTGTAPKSAAQQDRPESKPSIEVSTTFNFPRPPTPNEDKAIDAAAQNTAEVKNDIPGGVAAAAAATTKTDSGLPADGTIVSSTGKPPILTIEERVRSMAELDKLATENNFNKPPEESIMETAPSSPGGTNKSPQQGVTFGYSRTPQQPPQQQQQPAAPALMDKEASTGSFTEGAVPEPSSGITGGCDFASLENLILENTSCFRNTTIGDDQDDIYDISSPPKGSDAQKQQLKQLAPQNQQDEVSLPEVPKRVYACFEQEDVSMLHTVDTRDQLRAARAASRANSRRKNNGTKNLVESREI